VHDAGYGALQVHRSLDFVSSTDPIREVTDSNSLPSPGWILVARS
jgi:hypothetical protein